MFKSSIFLIIGIYAVALLGIYFFQRNFLYFPSSAYTPPRAAGAPAALEEFKTKTEDGLDLTGWYGRATSKPLTLVFFHGNADSLRTAAFIPSPYLAAGYGFLLTEYRGYSGMPGHPTEDDLYADARAYMKSLIASGVKEDNIVLFAHSLGTGVAVQMAKEFHVRGLILFAPYLSIAKVAQIHFPIFPADYLTKDRYENFGKISDIHMPVLMANGDRDTVIPPSQGKQLFALANEPKQFISVPEAGHNDLFESSLVYASLKWLEQLQVKAEK